MGFEVLGYRFQGLGFGVWFWGQFWGQVLGSGFGVRFRGAAHTVVQEEAQAGPGVIPVQKALQELGQEWGGLLHEHPHQHPRQLLVLRGGSNGAPHIQGAPQSTLQTLVGTPTPPKAPQNPMA